MNSGFVMLLIAEFCFALSTVFTKLVTNQSDIGAPEVTFFRFALGLIVVSIFVWKENISLKPFKPSLVIWRGVLNTSAVLLFFTGVEYSSVTNANMLNMTYPLFIFLFAPLLLKEKSPRIFYLFLALSMVGIYLVIHPNFSQINKGDLLALGSGVVGAFSVMSLRMARKYDSTTLILFYVMAIGFVINFIIMLPVYKTPHGIVAFYAFVSAVLGVIGQIFLTRGYKYVTAKSGGIISTGRIAFATLMGLFIMGETLNFQALIGGLLIVLALIGVNYYSQYK